MIQENVAMILSIHEEFMKTGAYSEIHAFACDE